jgi:hypothetical protein
MNLENVLFSTGSIEAANTYLSLKFKINFIDFILIYMMGVILRITHWKEGYQPSLSVCYKGVTPIDTESIGTST